MKRDKGFRLIFFYGDKCIYLKGNPTVNRREYVRKSAKVGLQIFQCTNESKP